MDQLGCEFFFDADVIITDYSKYADDFEVFTVCKLIPIQT